MTTRQALINQLIETGVLKTPRLVEAFKQIDRADFVPAEVKTRAYFDEPLPIGHGQTISQPTTVALMLEKLDPRPGERILDIGAGSGWQTALLASVVSHDDLGKLLPPAARGRVIGLEIIPELARQATTGIAHYNFIGKKIAEIHCRNATAGFPEAAPFDKIIAAASAEAIPPAWREELKSGGVIVAPVGEDIIVAKKLADGSFQEETMPGFLFVPFVSGKNT